MKTPTPDKKHIRAAFGRAASGYEQAAVVQCEVGARLLERLDYVKLAPVRVLDLGSGTGFALRSLSKRYPRANVVACDLSPAMLARTPRIGLFHRLPRVCADAERLPFADDAFDLVFSNLMLQWCDSSRAFAEMRRVLAPGGLLMFTTFGPDTLKELRAAWAAVDERPHVHDFPDMHDLGDLLAASGFAAPVMDREDITLTYTDAMAVMRDLKNIGATYKGETGKGLAGRGAFAAMASAYERFRNAEERLPATFEIVYGHAWAPEAPPRGKTIPIRAVR